MAMLTMLLTATAVSNGHVHNVTDGLCSIKWPCSQCYWQPLECQMVMFTMLLTASAVSNGHVHNVTDSHCSIKWPCSQCYWRPLQYQMAMFTMLLTATGVSNGHVHNVTDGLCSIKWPCSQCYWQQLESFVVHQVWQRGGSCGQASDSRAADLASIPVFAVDLFPGRVIPLTSEWVLHWLPFQEPGIMGLALGLVSLVSVYCDWVR